MGKNSYSPDFFNKCVFSILIKSILIVDFFAEATALHNPPFLCVCLLNIMVNLLMLSTTNKNVVLFTLRHCMSFYSKNMKKKSSNIV